MALLYPHNQWNSSVVLTFHRDFVAMGRQLRWLNRDKEMQKWFAKIAKREDVMLFITEMLQEPGPVVADGWETGRNLLPGDFN